MDYTKLREELIRDEGRRLKVYLDTKGNKTAGIGHLLPPDFPDEFITDEQCERWYAEDSAIAEEAARRIFKFFDRLSEAQQHAMVNMTFNRGEGRMRKSTKIVPAVAKFSATLDPADSNVAATEIKNSPWAKQVGSRAARIAAPFEV